MPQGSTKPTIFISYSHKDEPDVPVDGEVPWLSFVQSFLAPVVKVGVFDIWADPHLQGGDKIDPEIESKLASCDVFVLLTSRHSLASTYVVEREIAAIRQRQKNGEDVQIFPIVLSPVPNTALAQLSDLLLRPKDGNPLSLMTKNERDLAMAGVADDIAAVAAKIADRRSAAQYVRAQQREQQLQQQQGEFRQQSYVDIAHLPETAYERLVGRDAQLKRLDEAWTDSKTNVLSLIAEGGAGKSALVNEWLVRMRAEGYRGAEMVLGWSFYSQGTKERATSAEQFLNWAGEKLGIKTETTSATAKGEAIAETMAKRRVLLVLDGCEPLQHSLDKQQGELKDQGLRAMLRRFAATSPSERHGLLVLTSRLRIKDIVRWQESSAPVELVDKLSDEAGAALLRDNSVWGTDKELLAAAHDFGGHPLALGLLASFLKETQNGDVRRRDHIRAFFADAENPRHDHAKRVMESYEQEWLVGEPTLLAIMHIVGLFDRPASSDCLKALRKKPPIQGLTAQIVKLNENEWQRAIARLRGGRLLSPVDSSSPNTLDAHPLIREWFSDRLKQTNEIAWKAAHSRLYEHLRRTTKEGDEPTLEQLAPLYQAVSHGCRAGRYKEALIHIYQNRICRRSSDGRLAYYSGKKLGALNSDLSAVHYFFDKPYEVPILELEEGDRAWVLGEAAFNLRGQGRFVEALPAIRLALKMAVQAKQWSFAASIAINLSEAELVVGQVAAAVDAGAQSVVYADRGGDIYFTINNRSSHAAAVYGAGQYEEAKQLFSDAERRQKEFQPQYPLLYSFRGYQYCDLLLGDRNWAEVSERATVMVTWAARSPSASMVDSGLLRLLLVRMSLGFSLQHLTTVSSDTFPPFAEFDEVVDVLRAAGTLEFVTRGLLARAAFRRSLGDWNGTRRDLNEVEEISELGPMKLCLCDMALERARLLFARIEAFAPLNGLINDGLPKPDAPDADEAVRLKDDAAEQLAIVADYIQNCGYHRRDEELAELEAVLRGERKFADLPPRV